MFVPEQLFENSSMFFKKTCFSQSPSERKAFQQHCSCVLFIPFPVLKLQTYRKDLPEASVILHMETYHFSATPSSFLVSYRSLHLLLYFGIPILLFSGLWSQLLWGTKGTKVESRLLKWTPESLVHPSLETSYIFGNRSLKITVSICILNKKNLQ